jgi:photosystem II stability/assembly factor-like uncharacterized protein
MKKTVWLFVMGLFAIVSSNAMAQWVRTSGPDGGVVTCVTTLGSDIIVGTGSGVYVSNDSGNSWKLRNLGLPYPSSIVALVTIGTRTFVSTDLSGLFVSKDTCKSWLPLPSNSPSFVRTFGVLDTILFAANSIDGIFRSTNYGIDWLPLKAGALSFLTLSGHLFARGSAILLSTDTGNSWKDISTGLPATSNRQITGFTTNGTMTYAAIRKSSSHCALYSSTDFGTSWVQIDSSSIGITSLSLAGPILFASTRKGLSKSIDSGMTWSLDSTVFGVAPVSLSGGRLLSYYNWSGVYISSDSGNTWTSSKTTGLSCSDVWTLVANKGTLYAGTNGFGISLSTNNGNTWKSIVARFDSKIIYCEWR